MKKAIYIAFLFFTINVSYANLDFNVNVRSQRTEGKVNTNIELKSFHEIHVYNNNNYPYTFSYSFILRCDPKFNNYGKEITLKPFEHYHEQKEVNIVVNKDKVGKYQVLSQSILFGNNGSRLQYAEDGRLLVVRR